MFLSLCGGDGPLDELPDQDPPEEAGTVFVCDHLVATQKVLRGIPKSTSIWHRRTCISLISTPPMVTR